MAQILPISTKTPNALNYLATQQQTKPKFNLFDFSSVNNPITKTVNK